MRPTFSYGALQRLLSTVVALPLSLSLSPYVLQIMPMAYPNQAGSQQGSHGVSCDILAVNGLGIGLGWRQSRQNLALPAVVGNYARMACSVTSAARNWYNAALFASEVSGTPTAEFGNVQRRARPGDIHCLKKYCKLAACSEAF